MLPFVHTLFNRIFLSVFFSQAWPESISVPVFKKGGVSDPQIMTSLQTLSLDFYPIAIFCFSTTCIIDTTCTLRKKERLNCCFIDFKKAFNTVDKMK